MEWRQFPEEGIPPRCVVTVRSAARDERAIKIEAGARVAPDATMTRGCVTRGKDLHSSVSSSSALRSRSTSTGLLPLVSRPRSLSAARSSTTFSFDGSIMRARYAPLNGQAGSCTPYFLTGERKCSRKTHTHAPLTRAAYTIWRDGRKTVGYVARAAAIGRAARSCRTDAGRAGQSPPPSHPWQSAARSPIRPPLGGTRAHWPTRTPLLRI